MVRSPTPSIDEMNAFLQQTINSGQFDVDQAASTPEEQAQDIIYQAYEATGKRRTTLAKQALALWPDCADAYVLLGGAAKTPAEAKQLYQHGVEAISYAAGAVAAWHTTEGAADWMAETVAKEVEQGNL